MQHRLATTEARPTSRRLPMRATNSPLKNRYSAYETADRNTQNAPQAVAAPGVSRTSMPNTSSAPP